MIPLLLAAAVAVSSGSYDLPPGGKPGEVVRMGPGGKTEWVAGPERAWKDSTFDTILTIPVKIEPGSVMVEDKENPRHFVWRSTAEVCDPAYWRER